MTCSQEKCPLHGKRYVPTSRPIKDSYLVVMGEAPGRVEETQGIPFVGQSGQLLRKVLETMGLNLDEIAFTNVVHCRPPDNDTPSNDTCRLCMKEHEEEWEEIYKDKVVLVVGGTAAWAVCGARSIGSVRGITKKIGTSVFLFVWHPAYVVRNPKAIYQWTKEMQELLKLLERGEPERDKIPFTTIQNMRQLQEFVQRAKNTEIFSFDIETTGLDPWAEGARILCLSVATQGECVVIPLQHKNAPVWGNGIVRELKTLFSGIARKVGINVKFDMLWLKVIYGIDVANIYFDPQVAQHLLNEGIFTSISLEQLVWKYFPEEGGYKEELVGGNYKHLEETDEGTLYKYNCLDSIFALKLVDKIEPQIIEKGMGFLYFDIVNPTISTLVQMEYNGFQVDFDALKFQQRQMSQKIETMVL